MLIQNENPNIYAALAVKGLINSGTPEPIFPKQVDPDVWPMIGRHCRLDQLHVRCC